jgi:ABC-type hemin transport system substrate-binding protein
MFWFLNLGSWICSALRGRRMTSKMRLQLAATTLFTFLLALSPMQAQERAARVVALGGDTTEIVYALGEGHRLVGRDTTSGYPPEAKALPDVGYLRQLGAEGLLSLKPELVLASASAGPPIVLQQLKSAGVRLIQLPEAHDAETLHRKVTLIANELGVPEKGAKLAADLDENMTKAQAEIAAMPERPRVLFIMNAGNGAPLAAGATPQPLPSSRLLAAITSFPVIAATGPFRSRRRPPPIPTPSRLWSSRSPRWAAGKQ